MSDERPPITAAAPADDGQPDEGWERDKRGRAFTRHPSEARVVFRRGEETIAEALERDAKAPPRGDKRPRSKAAKKRMPPAPASVDSKQLEQLLAEALTAPAMPCAMFGDQWAAGHFAARGPELARNLVLASENNPWLRRKIEAMVTGQDAAAKALAMLGVTGALIGYAVPPIVWWFNLPVPERARMMLGVPPAREPAQPPDAEGSPRPAPAEPVAAAA